MTKEQVLAQQRADFAVAKFIEEIFESGHIKEYTFDETRDSALELSKILRLHLLQNERNMWQKRV